MLKGDADCGEEKLEQGKGKRIRSGGGGAGCRIK